MHMKYMRDTYLWNLGGRIHLETIVYALEADDFFDET